MIDNIFWCTPPPPLNILKVDVIRVQISVGSKAWRNVCEFYYLSIQKHNLEWV